MGFDALTAMDSQRTTAWACARVASDQLGVSERTLARWRGCGLFKPGRHWRRKFPSANSPVLYHLDLCQEAMGDASARMASMLEQPLPPTEATPIHRAFHRRR